VNPAVVSIQVVGATQGFRVPGPLVGEGSGFVWDESGHIVTNYHVVGQADTIYVTFAEGTVLEAEVIGADPESDLAVLEVEALDGFEWPAPVELASPEDLAVGQLAIAIGNPFGEEGTMTLGIISALGRLLPASGAMGIGGYSIPDIIQTDAAINPGNSGGALLNESGQLIGVPTAIAGVTGSYTGVGFAIPVGVVERVVPELIESGTFEHPYLGISGMALFPNLNEAMGLDATQRGALVVEVVPGGPADEAGLEGSTRSVRIDGVPFSVGGDVITAIDGEAVNDLDDIISYLENNTEVGETVTLTILRDGEEEEVEVTLDARPKAGTQAAVPEEAFEPGVQLGILGGVVTPEVTEEMGLPEDTEGVLVQEVVEDSPAEDAGLEAGDVITAFNDEPVTSVVELRAQLSAIEPGETATLTVLRDGEEQQIEVTFGEAEEEV
ncbi:MAG: PDZ domain-containing protein, partial [Chloroflexota bacterium]|nr:PDZ domain-containing protein [Chloroflexota bacterium]